MEAIEAYTTYADDEGGDLFEELLVDERQHAERLLSALKKRLGQG